VQLPFVEPELVLACQDSCTEHVLYTVSVHPCYACVQLPFVEPELILACQDSCTGHVLYTVSVYPCYACVQLPFVEPELVSACQDSCTEHVLYTVSVYPCYACVQLPFVEPELTALPEVPDQPLEEPTPHFNPPEQIVVDNFEEEEFVQLEPPTIPAAPVAPKFGKPQV